jgi:hypothetical protein
MTIPQLHMYDLETGEYTGSRDATQRPNGEYILEATGATAVALPADIPAGHVARWNGDVWELVEDHRQKLDEKGRKYGGTAYWLPAEGDTWQSPERYIEELGPLPEGAVTIRPEKPAPTLEEAKAAKLAEINRGCDVILQQAVAGYPETEQQTFYKQDAESAAYLENPETAETPFLTTLAATRGIDLETMVGKVRAKTDAFAQLSAYICGQRQAMEDRLDACGTVEDVQAIVVSYQVTRAA